MPSFDLCFPSPDARSNLPQISKLLSIIDFALASAADPDGLFNDLKLSPADELKKKAPGVFQFEVKSGKETEYWYADMKVCLASVCFPGACAEKGGLCRVPDGSTPVKRQRRPTSASSSMTRSETLFFLGNASLTCCGNRRTWSSSHWDS